MSAVSVKGQIGTDRKAALDVTIVVAVTRNGVIGRDGDMPWRMPSSLRRFRSLTLGRPMIMGRKTFQAIGRVLDGRDTIVVTRDPSFQAAGTHRAGSLDEALALANKLAEARGVDEVIIAGGGEIYGVALPYATEVQIDLIETEVQGDTRFPALDPSEWCEVERSAIEPHARDEHAATAIVFRRKTPAMPFTAA